MRKRIALIALALIAWGASAKADLSVINQATTSADVTPSDSTVFNPPTRGLYVGAAAACNLSLMLLGDQAVHIYANVQPGQVLPFQVKRVMAATTCTGIVALY